MLLNSWAQLPHAIDRLIFNIRIRTHSNKGIPTSTFLNVENGHYDTSTTPASFAYPLTVVKNHCHHDVTIGITERNFFT